MQRRSSETFAEAGKWKVLNESDEDKPKKRQEEADQLVPRLWPT